MAWTRNAVAIKGEFMMKFTLTMSKDISLYMGCWLGLILVRFTLVGAKTAIMAKLAIVRIRASCGDTYSATSGIGATARVDTSIHNEELSR